MKTTNIYSINGLDTRIFYHLISIDRSRVSAGDNEYASRAAVMHKLQALVTAELRQLVHGPLPYPLQPHLVVETGVSPGPIKAFWAVPAQSTFEFLAKMRDTDFQRQLLDEVGIEAPELNEIIPKHRSLPMRKAIELAYEMPRGMTISSPTQYPAWR